jgi:hypothetical protein
MYQLHDSGVQREVNSPHCSDNTVTMTALKLYPKLIQLTSHRHILFTCSAGVEPSPLLLQHQKGLLYV